MSLNRNIANKAKEVIHRRDGQRTDPVEIANFLTQLNRNNLLFNAMYLGDLATSKKYYEVYTTYNMLLSTTQLIRDCMQLYSRELQYIPGITDTITESSIPLIHRNLMGSSTDPFFEITAENMKRGGKNNRMKSSDGAGAGAGSPSNSFTNAQAKIQIRFQEYLANPHIFTFQTSGRVIPFQYFCRYIRDKRLQRLFSELANQYILLKNKILDVLRDYGTVQNSSGFQTKIVEYYGLLAFGFLFMHPHQPPLVPNAKTNAFLSQDLFDSSRGKVNINAKADELEKRVYSIFSRLTDQLNIFHTGGYQSLNMFDLLYSSIELDLRALEMILFYVHPKYMRYFLKKKDRIDKVIAGYVQETERPSLQGTSNSANTMNRMMASLFDPTASASSTNGLFQSFATYDPTKP